MGRRGDQPNPNSIGVFIPSRVRISRAASCFHSLTHQPAAARASDGAGRLRTSPRGVDAGAGPRPSACLSVGRSVPCLAGRACAWRCPSLVGVGGARSDGRPFVSASASAPTDTASAASARRCAPITASRATCSDRTRTDRAPSVSHLKWHRTQEYSQTLNATSLKCGGVSDGLSMRGELRPLGSTNHRTYPNLAPRNARASNDTALQENADP